MEPTDGDARPHPLDRQPQLRKNGQLMSRLVLYEEYRAKVPGTIATYGGRYLVRGGDPVHLEGDRPLRRFVVLEFASPQRASEWYHSEEYRPLKALRQKAAVTHLFLVNGVEGG
jgi:uncharacterized protein (DUF1330 family)